MSQSSVIVLIPDNGRFKPEYQGIDVDREGYQTGPLRIFPTVSDPEDTTRVIGDYTGVVSPAELERSMGRSRSRYMYHGHLIEEERL